MRMAACQIADVAVKTILLQELFTHTSIVVSFESLQTATMGGESAAIYVNEYNAGCFRV